MRCYARHGMQPQPLTAALDRFGDPTVLYHPQPSSLLEHHLSTDCQECVGWSLLSLSERILSWLAVLQLDEVTFDGMESDPIVNAAVAILTPPEWLTVNDVLDGYPAMVVEAVAAPILDEYGVAGFRELTGHVFGCGYQLARMLTNHRGNGVNDVLPAEQNG